MGWGQPARTYSPPAPRTNAANVHTADESHTTNDSGRADSYVVTHPLLPTCMSSPGDKAGYHPVSPVPATAGEDLGADFYQSRLHKQRRERDLIRKLETLTGKAVTLGPSQPAA